VTGQTQPDDMASQVLRYGARSLGTTQIVLRYGQPAAAQPGDPTMTFTVNVIDPSAPTTAPPSTDTTSTTAPVTSAPTSPSTTRPRATTTTTSKRTTTTA
jgi:hypothetical protein